jgi:hypothetical protein
MGDAVTSINRADSASVKLNWADAAPISCGLQQQLATRPLHGPDQHRYRASAVSTADSWTRIF